MAREKSDMELYDLFQRIRLGHSNNRIHRETRTHRTVIRRLRAIADAQGWSGQEADMPSDKEIYSAYHAKEKNISLHPLEAYRKNFENYVKNKYSYVVMHQLIKERYDCSESTVRRFVQKHIESTVPRAKVIRDRELSMMEVDFGEPGIVYDTVEERNRKAYVFSGRLRYSAKAYRKVVFNQRQETFWQCHIETFERFGGVPERVQDEIERRDFKALVSRLKKSKLDPMMTLETFDFRFNTQIHEPLIKELISLSFIEKHENIFFVGPSGVGKTHLATAIGHEVCRQGIDVLFRRTYSILKWLGSGRADNTYDRKLKYLGRMPLLILDDFGLNDLNQIQQNDLYELICTRYEHASTIITSNRDFSEWLTIFDNPLIGSAAMDRLVHRAVKIVIEGLSYRLEAFSAKNNIQVDK